MNRYITFLILLAVSLKSFPQETKSQNVSVGVGKSWHPDIIDNQKNYNVSITYQDKFAEVFAYDIFIQYSAINSFPDFFENRDELNNFITGQEVFPAIGNTLWDEIKTFSLGSKIHYSFVNNSKFFFSIYVGAGIYNSTSKTAILNILKSAPDYGLVKEFDFTIPKETYTGIYYMPGIQFNYNVYRDYIIGLDLNLHRNLDTDKTDWLPVTPSFYGSYISIGKKF